MNKPPEKELASVPAGVRRFMDGMLSHLRMIERARRLEAYAYAFGPEDRWWLHQLCGTRNGVRFAIQICVSRKRAKRREAIVYLCLTSYWDDDGWEDLEDIEVRGLDELVSAIHYLVDEALEVCGPEPSLPAPIRALA